MRTPIIPSRQTFAKRRSDHSINYKSICAFAAAGFFLKEDTYFNDVTVLQPFTDYEVDENGFIISGKKYWNWHYSPKDISLKQATEEFADLFEKISKNNLKNKKVILPLSGGIDSRTQAAALTGNENVNCYSYKFENSFNETKYGREICRKTNFNFKEYVIPEGYLWKVIDRLAEINKCYADFTHPRQMAVIDRISESGEIFYLGHWGDVLFDDMRANEGSSFEEQVDFAIKKILKKGGRELAVKLWEAWGLDGNFDEYFKERISYMYSEIAIENINARIRAFKSMYWAPRWTSANMNVFGDYREMYIPYYSDEMCKFICTIPESLLSGRQIQIEYIKMKSPALAKIPWQTFDPMNLYNYKNYDKAFNIPFRAVRKLKRVFREKLLSEKIITRNWEIQFTGKDNEAELKSFLFDKKFNNELVPEEIPEYFLHKFKNSDSVFYSHPVSMLLTLSLFSKKFMHG